MKLLLSAKHQRECAARFATLAPALTQIGATEEGVLPEDLDDVEVIFYGGRGLWMPGNVHLSRFVELPSLRWLHTITAGVDDPRFAALVARGVKVTSSPAAAAPSVAQFVLSSMLRVVRLTDLLAEQQRQRVWKMPMPQPNMGELTGQTVGIVGLGHIGQEVARLCRAFGMHVLGCRRSTERSSHVDEQPSLPEVLARSSFVVLCLPLNPETRHLIDATTLRTMQPGAWLINVARGQIVNDQALQQALREQRIGGACLDVFEREPLPPDDPYWTLPNVFITPHNAAVSAAYGQRLVAAFEQNLKRYVAGEPLLDRLA